MRPGGAPAPEALRLRGHAADDVADGLRGRGVRLDPALARLRDPSGQESRLRGGDAQGADRADRAAPTTAEVPAESANEAESACRAQAKRSKPKRLRRLRLRAESGAPVEPRRRRPTPKFGSRRPKRTPRTAQSAEPEPSRRSRSKRPPSQAASSPGWKRAEGEAAESEAVATETEAAAGRPSRRNGSRFGVLRRAGALSRRKRNRRIRRRARRARPAWRSRDPRRLMAASDATPRLLRRQAPAPSLEAAAPAPAGDGGAGGSRDEATKSASPTAAVGLRRSRGRARTRSRRPRRQADRANMAAPPRRGKSRGLSPSILIRRSRNCWRSSRCLKDATRGPSGSPATEFPPARRKPGRETGEAKSAARTVFRLA